jgi:hypothetical protein
MEYGPWIQVSALGCSQHYTEVMCSVPEAEVTRNQVEGYTRHGWCITAKQVCWGTSVWVFHGAQMHVVFVHVCCYTERPYTLWPTNGTVVSLMSLELRSPRTSHCSQHWLLVPSFIISAEEKPTESSHCRPISIPITGWNTNCIYEVRCPA